MTLWLHEPDLLIVDHLHQLLPDHPAQMQHYPAQAVVCQTLHADQVSRLLLIIKYQFTLMQ